MSVEWRRNLEMDGEEPEVVDTRLRKSQPADPRQPLLIIPCLYMQARTTTPTPPPRGRMTMAVQSLGAAVRTCS